jgi:hypothetical protein
MAEVAGGHDHIVGVVLRLERHESCVRLECCIMSVIKN